MLVFDQEIYNQFRYKTPRPSYFHTFEADECQVGLNFADEDEANYFRQTIENKLAERRQRRERRNALKRQGQNPNAQADLSLVKAPPPPSSSVPPPPSSMAAVAP